MKARIAPILGAAVVVCAGGLSLLYAEQAPEPRAAAAPTPAAVDDLPVPQPQELPPDHPPIVTGNSPHGMQGAIGAGSDEAPAITWKVPESWQTAPNPNPMRVATYRPSPQTEVSVARAGGSTEANIERWIGQFDDASHEVRTEKTVRGLAVRIVEVSGTYAGGGMAPGTSESHPGWTLVGAVVETPDSPHYFFKLLGPTEQVRAARASLDALLASIAPR
jgi:hypothetical protein